MSVINSDSNVKDINQTALETRICVVSDDTANYDGLNQALQELECTVVYSTNGLEYIDDAADKYDTVFVFNNFEGRDYDCLHKMDHRIMGPPVILKCANSKEPLPYNTRPLYCTLMSQLIICFTGFRNKAEITRLVNLVHHMGGSIRKDFSTRVTHLVANTTNGNKYRTAVSLGTPVMTEQWVHQAWSTRHDSTGSAIDEDMMQYKMMPFFCCCLSFMGFSDEEQKHMEEVTQMQGGSSAPVGDKSCTHLVIDDVTVKDLPFECNGKIHIVKSEWFWGSIQMAACADETMYRFTKVDSSDHKTSTPGTPVARSRKRRRLRESIAALSKESEHESPHVPPRKRRSSDMGMLSMSGSFLDASHTPDSSITLRTACTPQSVDTAPTTPPAPPKRIISKREHIAMELLQTESNYVGILHTIIKVFKEPLEQNQTGGPLIPAEDIKTIFGSIPIIYEVHMKLKEDLSELLADYSDDKSIGEIILRHSSGMMKAYPQFVNYFEMTKETVNKCDKQFPRFHAFLKICQSKPECGRQTLCELLIRPVQRLPSMILLLQDLLKRTDSSSPDLEQVERSITAVKEVTKHINEDKRKTEGHTQMFDVINDIEGVPPHLLSSHRSLIMRCDTVEISDRENGKGDNFSEKGANVSMFLFNDCLEICKRRSKIVNTYRSPASLTVKALQKGYKHLELLSLSHIRRVLDINETEDCQNAFAILVRPIDGLDRTDRIYMFMLTGEDQNKSTWLKTLCKHMANTTCKADSENFLTQIDPQELEISKSDFDVGKFGRAIRVARKATKKVGRTFSFNKTPRRIVQRAKSVMSTSMSPLVMNNPTTSCRTVTPKRDEMMGARLASSSSLKYAYLVTELLLSPRKKKK